MAGEGQAHGAPRWGRTGHANVMAKVGAPPHPPLPRAPPCLVARNRHCPHCPWPIPSCSPLPPRPLPPDTPPLSPAGGAGLGVLCGGQAHGGWLGLRGRQARVRGRSPQRRGYRPCCETAASSRSRSGSSRGAAVGSIAWHGMAWAGAPWGLGSWGRSMLAATRMCSRVLPSSQDFGLSTPMDPTKTHLSNYRAGTPFFMWVLATGVLEPTAHGLSRGEGGRSGGPRAGAWAVEQPANHPAWAEPCA